MVSAGIEKLRIVLGFTQSSALDLYRMPYTHGRGARRRGRASAIGAAP
jgi:hypothetical protein